VAEVLRQFADRLETAADFATELHELIRDTILAHKRILFNGNGYDAAWVEEAERRGLLNLRTTPDALPYLLKEKNIRLFTENQIFSETELRSRYEIYTENYCKVLNIEALTMIDMARRQILPAVAKYSRALAETALAERQLVPDADLFMEEDLVAKIAVTKSEAYRCVRDLERMMEEVHRCTTNSEAALIYRDRVIPRMAELRASCDTLEMMVDAECWPYPTYGELLFGVR
jgi:glutamine synthetase